ncbi:tRNA lysidine(34) synthetase TilS [Actinoallomurus purpureus]|nr:tRNA lysidine(34) synthetase TilS [Actinoallomurus purpureus]MCO6004262.1 tRNA lysidine(34) synthetase TilS [Actinoallomurus purpureus]
MGPDPAVAAVRLAVRGTLREIEPGDLVLVACSGGADSLALAGALAFEAARSGHRAGGITVDHGLQEGSAERAAGVVRTMAGLGLDPVEAVRVAVGTSGGPEAAARDARYTALADAAARHRAAAVLLGHTLDDQAETVLLGLARGSGARSLAGMPKAAGRYRRPLLDLDRDLIRRACLAMGLAPWDDPHNGDPAFARVRVRRDVLPVLERELGPRVAAALARTARMLRDDADALDAWAERALREATVPAGAPTPRSAGGSPPAETGEGAAHGRRAGASPREAGGAAVPTADARTEKAPSALRVGALAELPRAVRTRVLRRAAIAAGSPPGTLAAVHIDAADALVTAWRGQSHVDLPGRVRVWRRYEKLLFGPSESSEI